MLVLSVLKKTFKSLYLYEILSCIIPSIVELDAIWNAKSGKWVCHLSCDWERRLFPWQDRHFVIHCLWFQNHHFLQWRAQRPFFRGICKVILKPWVLKKQVKMQKGAYLCPMRFSWSWPFASVSVFPFSSFQLKGESGRFGITLIHVKFI